MKKWQKLALLFSLLSVGFHFYLSHRSYQIDAGQSEKSQICNISERMNCDEVLQTPYSKIFEIPLSNFGLAFNLALSLILLGFLLNFLNRTTYWKSATLSLSGFIAFMSLILLTLSVAIKQFCPVCLILYFCSFVSFIACFFAFKQDGERDSLWRLLKNKTTFITLGIILSLALFMHMSLIIRFDLKSINQKNKLVYLDWTQSQTEHFKLPGILSTGAKKSPFRIIEFADFLCPHCKKVHKILKTFLKSHPEVSFQLYLYPLDGECNPAIASQGKGRSCDLAKILICGKEQSRAENIHDILFEKQGEFSTQPLSQILDFVTRQTDLDLTRLKNCMKSQKTKKLLADQVSVGNELKIPGTPVLFVNEKRLYTTGDMRTLLQNLYYKIKKN